MKIRFEDLQTANEWRDENQEYRAEEDDARRKTVYIDDDAPDDVVDEAREMAGEGEADVQEDADGQELTGKQLGALRRAWGAYIGGVSQAEEAFETINDVRSDVNQEPLSFGDLYNEPRDSTELLLEQLELDPDVVPSGHTTEEFAKIARTDTTGGRVPSEDVMQRLDEEGVTMSPEELEGVGSAGVGQMSLEEQLKEETQAEREVIAEDLALENKDLEKSFQDDDAGEELDSDADMIGETMEKETRGVLFELEADTSAVIKPVLNAAQRCVGKARVEMSDDGMRIAGVSPGGIEFVDIDVDPSTFDTFDVRNTGAFETDIGDWYDAYQGERKTDSTRIVAKMPEYDDLEDVKGIRGSRMVEILENNGIRSPDALRQAPVEELTGSVDYEVSTHRSGTETRTEEIDKEKARELKQEVTTPFVKIYVDGEDVIGGKSPGSYPRVREPTAATSDRLESLPEIDTTAEATINGRDFSKTVRAADELSDEMFLGIAEGELIMHSEGDVDELHATPNADVSGSGAGKRYTIEDHLNQLRMAIDRKASTDVTLTLPDLDNEGGDEDVDENGAPILTANFPIEKSGAGHASVTWGQAPRIRTEEDAPTDREQLQELLPSNYEPLENARYEAAAEAGEFKGWFRVLAAHADECKLEIDADGIATKFVDPANVAMIDAEIPRLAFDDYVARGPAGVLRENDGVFGISQKKVLEYLKKLNKRDDVRLKVGAGRQIALESDRFTVTLATIDPDSVRQEPNLPEIPQSAHAEVDATSMIEGIDDVADVTDHVALIVYEGDVYLYGEDLEEEFVDVEDIGDDGVGNAISLYSLEYFEDHMNAIPSGGRTTFNIYLGSEFPLLLNYDIFGADVTWMLAPRVVDPDGSGDNSSTLEGAKEALEERGMDSDRLEDAKDRFQVTSEKGDIQVDTDSLEGEVAA